MRAYIRLGRSGFCLLTVLAACGGRPSRPASGRDSALAGPPVPPLAYLRTYVGRYPGDERLWATEPLHSRMTRLLGGDYNRFLENLTRDQPLTEAAGLLYVMGTCPSSARVWGAALVVIDPQGDRMVLKLHSDADQQTRTWAEGEIPVLPGEVMKALRSWDERAAPSPGPGVKKKPEETKG